MANSVIVYLLVLFPMTDYCTSAHITSVSETFTILNTNQTKNLEHVHRIGNNIGNVIGVSAIDEGVRKFTYANTACYVLLVIAIKIAVIVIVTCLVLYKRNRNGTRQNSICENTAFEDNTLKTPGLFENYVPTYDYMSNYFSSPKTPCPCVNTHCSSQVAQETRVDTSDDIEYYNALDAHFINKMNKAWQEKKNRCENLRRQSEDQTRNHADDTTIIQTP